MKLKTILSCAMCAAAVLSLVACGSGEPMDGTNGGQCLPNPFTEYQTLEEAEKEAGFALGLPQSIAGYSASAYRLDKENGLLEAIFENGEENIIFRKALGGGDVSGNYNEFAEKAEVELNGVAVAMKGAEGKINIATWENGGYAYSVDCTASVEEDVMIGFVETVMGGAM